MSGTNAKKLNQNFAIFPADPSSEKKWSCIAKRRQVKNACINCQRACKKCDEGRPCQRCIKYGLTDTCRNSLRKDRRRRPIFDTNHYSSLSGPPRFTIIATGNPLYYPEESLQDLTQQADPALGHEALAWTPPPSPGVNPEITAQMHFNLGSRPSSNTKMTLPSPQVSPKMAEFDRTLWLKRFGGFKQPTLATAHQFPPELGPKLPPIKHFHKPLPSIKEILHLSN
ncbi:hypothetical protein K493DRAFT_388490 [Basidiobolus meristosporus CBS 931.73]|uniref:Zn(2)-C6 fungal-type domain-containing protein n=1 Tax=Basidiobolus meristosporus CBS 931.73 TaxID=1314790 RepID=A0A1Y1XAH9_9FUNG|nr:hypothetical protein K493DRAFT_388490 [Basidiobolus meristosporus CBS 931.73]|eukprot:ORX82748.1 hypothetical protein K493DRAFT_388490 [Basidiobolus meristosporus CBS 931.73]